MKTKVSDYFTIMDLVLLVKYSECQGSTYSALGLLHISMYSITVQRRRFVLTGPIVLLEIQVVAVEIAFTELSSA